MLLSPLVVTPECFYQGSTVFKAFGFPIEDFGNDRGGGFPTTNFGNDK